MCVILCADCNATFKEAVKRIITRQLSFTFVHTGPICGGHCCDNATEQELTITSSNQFANNLRIHTQNLRRTLEKTAETYKGKWFSVCVDVLAIYLESLNGMHFMVV